MHIIEAIQRFGIEFFGRYYSTYRGVVLDNIDEDHTNKLKVVVPNVQDGIRVWARPKVGQGTLKSGFKYLTPSVGDIVLVEFEKGDPLRPLWSYHGWAATEVPDDLQPNTSMGFITPRGNKVVLKDVDGILDIETNTQVKLTIFEGSTIEVNKDQIVINQGENGALINIDTLVDNLQSLKAFVEDMHSAIPSALTAVGTSTAASGPTGSSNYSTSMAGKTITIEDMNDDKVIH